ncbi:phytoene/squalene synthase family protein [Stappia indica]|uniref:phytoene/squalene synthase family protein n=1 Tax=Stappia indica TaxID=538381 RepID=UPI001CD2DE53|nr:phytoene/squalene synthase family protein [Stappia indica]MCA1296954.1 squalene/phytoene synthase family protein [Stappia indica]
MSAEQSPGDEHCLALVRQHDFDRYLSLLFAPEAERGGLAALYAFNMEVARAREIVSDPMPGEIRLQWWRDALQAPAGGDADQHPVAGAIRRTIETYHLPLEAFLNLIDARIFDLYDDPMPCLGDLEGYAGETSSALIQLAAIVLSKGTDPDTAEISGHAGVAYALTGLMRALPWHSARRQLYLPADLLDAHGVDRETVFRGECTPALKAALRELAGIAHSHLARTRARIDGLPAAVVPAFLPVCLVEPLLERMAHQDFDLFAKPPELSRLRRQWILWRSWRRAGKRV